MAESKETMTSLHKCGPCTRDHQNNQPIVWCIECEEPLCTDCKKAHQLIKTTHEHHLIELNTTTVDILSDIRLSVLQTCSIHSKLVLDCYCKEHDVLCCPSCKIEQHQKCEHVLPLEQAAKGIKTSQTVEVTNSNLNNALKLLSELRAHSTMNIENLNHNEIEIKQNIERIQFDIINRTNELSEGTFVKLSGSKAEEIAKLEEQLKFIQNMTKAMEARQKHMHFIRENGSEIHTFILTHKLMSELSKDEKVIKKTLKATHTVSLRFTEVEDVVSSIKSIGGVQVLSDPSGLKFSPFSKVGKSTKASKLKYPIKSFKLHLEFEPEVKEGFVSGIWITDDDTILLCIRGTNKLLLYNYDGYLGDEIVLAGNPFNVAAISTVDMAVVSLPDSSKLQMVDLDLKESEDLIDLPESCWSVTVIEDKLIAAGGFDKIYLLDVEGKRLQEITKPEHGRTYSLCFSDNMFYYCADIDFKNENVYSITEDGEFVMCYSNAYVKTPTGIAVDPFGKVYISDLDSNNVQRYSKSGHYVDVLLKGDEVTEPRAICFNKTCKVFALSNNGGKSVCVFQTSLAM